MTPNLQLFETLFNLVVNAGVPGVAIVVALVKVLGDLWDIPSRSKPALSLAVGILWTVLIAVLMIDPISPLLVGMAVAVGVIVGLMASGLFSFATAGKPSADEPLALPPVSVPPEPLAISIPSESWSSSAKTTAGYLPPIIPLEFTPTGPASVPRVVQTVSTPPPTTDIPRNRPGKAGAFTSPN